MAIQVAQDELLDGQVLGQHLVEEVEAEAGEVEHLPADRLDLVALLRADPLGHAAGHAGARMDPPAADHLDDAVAGAAASMTRLPTSAPTFRMTPRMLRSATGASGPTMRSGPQST